MRSLIIAQPKVLQEKLTRLKLISLYRDVHKLKVTQVRYLVLEEKRDDILFYLLFPDKFFKSFYSQIWDFQDAHSRSLILGSRGFGKTLTNRVRQVGKILRNPNKRLLVASKTDGQAMAISGSIKRALESSLITEIFGNQVGSPWGDKTFTVAGRTTGDKEGTLNTVGIDGAVAGKSFTDHVLDDLIDEENTRTRARRKGTLKWYQMVLVPTLPEGGTLEALGTRYNPDDLWGSFIKHELKRSHLVIDCFDPKFVNHDVSIFPEKASTKWLKKQRKELGSIIFNSQYRNSVEAMKGEIFKYEWFNFADKAPSELKNFQGVDLSVTEVDLKNNAQFAIATIGIDGAKIPNIWVIDAYKRFLRFPQQTKMIALKHRQWDPIRSGIEANGYQKAKFLEIRHDPKYADLRVVPVYTTKDKVSNAHKTSALFEQGRVYVLDHLHDFIDDLLQLPGSGIWDLFDAFYIALRLAFSRVKKKREHEPDLIS